MMGAVFVLCFVVVIAAIAAAWVKRKWVSMNHNIAALDARIANLNRENETLRTAVAARAEGLGEQSLNGLAAYSRALGIEIFYQIELLKESTQNLPFDEINEQIALTRVVDRKRRFASYLDALLKANADIPAVIEVLQEDEAFIRDLGARIESHRLDAAAGQLELDAIASVFASLTEETRSQLWEELVTDSQKAQAKKVQEFRDAWFAAGERIRRAKVSNPRVLRAALDLPKKTD